METRQLGQTDLHISRLGVGLAELGKLSLDETDTAADILNTALDNGLNFLDTAACYSNSEDLIGRTVSHRREEYILATKCGHVAGDYQGQEWTAQTITASIERSLKRMRTDYLDLVQLHSCEIDTLERGEAIEALQQAQQAGKTRYIGYSGDNEAARWAVESGLFDTLQTSFNLVEQRPRTMLFPPLRAQGMGLIVKRPIANAVWGADQSPSDYAQDYFRRAEKMKHRESIPGAPDNGIVLALGFTLAHDPVDVAIVGTRNPDHMRANIAWAETELPLPPEVIIELHKRFDAVGQGWEQRR